MKIDLAQSLRGLSDIKSGEGDEEKNHVLLALDTPEVKTALIALILNESRAFKTARTKIEVGGIVQSKTYDTEAGMAKISAWVDLLDIPALIENLNTQPAEPEQDRLPE
jgi:hypothetical protein